MADGCSNAVEGTSWERRVREKNEKSFSISVATLAVKLVAVRFGVCKNVLDGYLRIATRKEIPAEPVHGVCQGKVLYHEEEVLNTRLEKDEWVVTHARLRRVNAMTVGVAELQHGKVMCSAKHLLQMRG